MTQRGDCDPRALGGRQVKPTKNLEPVRPAEPPKQKKSPRQARSQFTLNVILEAADQLLEQHKTVAAITTRRVAARAGVGISTLYDYFPNRDAIVIQLLNRRMKAHCQAALPGFRGALGESLPTLLFQSLEQAIDMDRLPTRLALRRRRSSTRSTPPGVWSRRFAAS